MSIQNGQRGTAFLVVLLVVAAAIVIGGVVYGYLAVRADPAVTTTNTPTTNVNATTNINTANTNAALNTNAVANMNVPVDASMVAFLGGDVSATCTTDADCTLANREMDLRVCCRAPECAKFNADAWVAVNQQSLSSLLASKRVEGDCARQACPQYAPTPPVCPDTVENRQYQARCEKGRCEKVRLAITSRGDPPCDSLTDRSSCEARADCLSVDRCSFTTADNQMKKCDRVPAQSGACVEGGFARCVALDCTVDQSTLKPVP